MQSFWKTCHTTLGDHNDDFNMRWRQISQQISLFGEYLFNDVINVYSWLASWKKLTSVPFLMNFSCWKCADDGCLGTMVSLLIGLLYMQVCNSLWIIAKIKTREMSEPNSRKYLPAKISTETVVFQLCLFVVAHFFSRKLNGAHVSILSNKIYAMTLSPFSKWDTVWRVPNEENFILL